MVIGDRIAGQRGLRQVATVSAAELRARSAAGWRIWQGYVSPRGIETQRRSAVRKLLLCFLCGYGEFPAPLVPELAAAATVSVASMLRAVDEDSANEPAVKAEALAGLADILRRCADAAATADHRRAALILLARAASLRSLYVGTNVALHDAVQASREAIGSWAEDDLVPTEQLVVLATTLIMQGTRTGAEDARLALDSAAAALRRALVVAERAGTRSDAAKVLGLLCVCLRVRFERCGDEADLDDAVASGFRAIELENIESGVRQTALLRLANALRVRYRLSGSLATLEEALRYSKEAAAAAPPGFGYDPVAHASYAAALLDRFERKGTEKDLDEAVDVLRRAVMTRRPHEDREIPLSNLGVALFHRYNLKGAEADLDGAIAFARESIAASPPGRGELARFHTNLSTALGARFMRRNEQQDIDEAVLTSRRAVDLTSAHHQDFAGYLANLGARLHQRFRHGKARDDLAEAIRTLTTAAEVVPADAPMRRVILMALSMARLDRFGDTTDPSTVDGVVEELTAAVQALPAAHPKRGLAQARLGETWLSRFRVSGDRQDGLTAEAWFEQAATVTSLSPVIRMHAWTKAAELAAERDAHAVAAARFEQAVLLLPILAPRRLHSHDQQFFLAAYPGIAAAAAALLLRTADGHDPARALAALELGRGVLLSHALNTRDDVTELKERHRGLAGRYVRLRDLLDAQGEDLYSGERVERAGLLRERIAGDRQRTTDAFDAVLAEIRALPGFHRFGLPPEPADLRPPRGVGTVVLLNVSEYGSDALLVTADGVDRVPLPALTLKSVNDKVSALQKATDTREDQYATAVEYMAANATLPEVLSWLWDVMAEPVLNAIGATEKPKAGAAWPHVWWVLGAPLALLPVHAAGHHREHLRSGGGRTVLDRVISSYAPTVRAVRHAYRSEEPPRPARRSLIVAVPGDPDAEGVSVLPYALDEAEALSRLLPAAEVLLSGPRLRTLHRRMVRGRPNADTVRSGLARAEIVHFACHGVTDPANPSQNGLVLEDPTNLFTVGDLGAIRSTNPRLAYLSACSTARNDATALADESIHLVSACQLAGFVHVVGTLWTVGDNAARTMATEFYTGLRTESGQLDIARSAAVLHGITRGLRDRKRSEWGWAPYVHAGRGPT